jgi:large subunit ribosomal protein L21
VSYAVVRAGGFQYRVSEGDRIKVPRLENEPGDAVQLDEVLALSRDGELTVGTPLVEGASVDAEVLSHGRRPKIIVYKKKRRKGYQKTQGHRQDFTELKIRGISGS